MNRDELEDNSYKPNEVPGTRAQRVGETGVEFVGNNWVEYGRAASSISVEVDIF
jgi:hypothetical protein